MIGVITWTLDPILFQFGGIRVGWYGILFAVGLIVFGGGILGKMWKHEGLSDQSYNWLVVYILVATVVGARLGHCLFYEPAYYLANPLEILQTWKGGLASHGGVIGIMVAVYLYSKKVSKQSMLWTFDRLCVPTGLVAAMIRLGNLANHEIYGHATDVPWAFRFIENIPQWQMGAEPIFTAPSHPTQLYEALTYLLTFGVCMWLYWKKDAYKHEGLIFGVAMIMIFVARFLIEFVKNDQVGFEVDMSLNMGQWLSLPFILIGIAAVVFSLKRPVKEYQRGGNSIYEKR
ncbi:prolipoprotein diacylglyceryl transferase [Porphyromonas levii]|uniref:prolipoprotein diacylglyceryl transferase n=1 Tax=Porphyromonas levii TaxID=28114 RepID=UPI001B8D719D|nr:prolipoprotein diacylglyceryl transferase [Porphyromonas levii]MBR8713379.1 Phosphatidylglycerol--prolipoprotein diacylglyceryl transferase [Porphyromonas levii]MBR8715414.1 Phosphatidylglycerol--prolipoprotein diacylglyceryl transferase [Porphyromonas levii]MBR8727935.1 Phosphatidylglycerol--prolipoprotein diacylglyceryl transferase [Porphyromonas levii]MBR8736284.1 Phosphatidylglycerol--prolipoprotein diacylglyceryl transferase [Porphyromonas levii]MBR8759868.1 Phosphatidylglycerol--proli